jgi:hypothetical protein
MGRLTVRCASVSGWGAPLAGLFRPTGPVRERVRLGRAIGRTVSPCRSGARACPVGARHWPDYFALPVRYASVSRWGRAIGRTVSPYQSGTRVGRVACRALSQTPRHRFEQWAHRVRSFISHVGNAECLAFDLAVSPIDLETRLLPKPLNKFR